MYGAGNLSLDLPAVDRMATCRPRGVTATIAGVLQWLVEGVEWNGAVGNGD